MAEVILSDAPDVLGLSVYIWNVDELTRLTALLKTVAPSLVIVIGGPEVSFESERQAIFHQADYLVCGAGERAFASLCSNLAAGRRPILKTIAGDSLLVDQIELPYCEYTDEDIAHRYLYVEASRGCPFKCEFCLSSLDRTALAFDQTLLLENLGRLYERGARNFKFIDRTFNLKIDDCRRILEFFLGRIAAQPHERLLLHFELVPDHLPDRLRELIVRFPAGVLQFEIGIQTWNTEVQALISRRQNNQAAADNLRWLRSASSAHLHVDLIAGLPGESLASFASGFDRLVALGPHEIQVGVLKRLRGTPIIRHTEPFGLRFNPNPPYNLLASDLISFAQMQRLQRFSRFWDLIGNSGHFTTVLPYILGKNSGCDDNSLSTCSPFQRFERLAEHIYHATDSTHRFSAERLFSLVASWMAHDGLDSTAATAALSADRTRRFAYRSPLPSPQRRVGVGKATTPILRHQRSTR